jgi:ComF family protein
MITFRALAAALADVLAPPLCAACDQRLACRAVFCPACAASVVRLPHRRPREDALFSLLAFAAFGGSIATALRRLKYGDRPDIAAPLGDLLRFTARGARLSADVVVPVPLHPARLAERGYNQAALLASAVAWELGAPLSARALRRTRATAQQARLDRERRRDNVAGAFSVHAPGGVRGRRVVLVDDVTTTGSTLTACAGALVEAGAATVTALVVAQADREEDVTDDCGPRPA